MARFVLHTLHAGAADLGVALPLYATVLRQLRDRDGRGYWQARLDRPVTFQPAEPAAAALWIHDLIVTPSEPDRALHAGMRDLAVDVAAVIDSRISDDHLLDPGKVAGIGAGLIDDLDQDAPPEPRPPAPAAPPAEEKAPRSFRADLQTWVARLASVAAEQPDQIPRETHTGPGYTIGTDELTYRSAGPDGSTRTRATTDPDELLFWIVDDLARDLATHWTLRAPAFRGDDDAGRELLLARWQNLMAALSTDWGRRTAAHRGAQPATPVDHEDR
jgi:hypothetical protein